MARIVILLAEEPQWGPKDLYPKISAGNYRLSGRGQKTMSAKRRPLSWGRKLRGLFNRRGWGRIVAGDFLVVVFYSVLSNPCGLDAPEFIN